MTRSLQQPKGRAAHAFFLALGMAVVLFLPFLIIDRGYFIYYGDFNVQQIPFYRMVHDAVLRGDVFWNWNTDLGVNFIGSYSFYLLGSPFFWLTLPFPGAAVPYLMAPLLILKFAFSSLAAYAYLRRFVKPDFAVLGGLLYAFSGFSIYNVFFNHFHEAIVYFPLMLLGLELYMKDNRPGLFGLMVFLSALSNYYFFIGQVFFLLIYWFLRMFSGDWTCTLSKFLWLLFEAVVGTAMAGVFLLPSYFAVIQNPRTESLIAGWDALIYNKPQRFYDVIHSFFFPQDIPARENFFPNSDNKWASMSAWLPVFGCSGAIAYFQSRKHRDWLRRLLIVLFFCAIIPGLNAMFQLFNWVYYARWYYMLVLMLVLATVLCFEQADTAPVEWKRAFGWAFGITAAFTLFIGLMPKSWEPDAETGRITLGLMEHIDRFWIYVVIAMVSLVLAALLAWMFRTEREIFYRWGVGVIACVSLIYSWYFLGLGKANSNYTSRFVIEQGIEGGDNISLPDENQFSRVDMNKGMDNQAMFWDMSSINAFHSIVPGSVMEFYPTIGISRGVATRPEPAHYAVRSLLSTRWLFDYANDNKKEYKKDEDFFSVDGVTKMPGWSYYDKQNGFLIYENDAYIPMGFTYDQYLTRTDYDAMSESRRELSLLKALVLEDADIPDAAKILPAMVTENETFNEAAYFIDCGDRSGETASSFLRDTRGFSAAISLKESNFVFFSVPYEEGWSATVNGQPAKIYKANVGFMAVLCPAGTDVKIRFDYMTPGLPLGLLITLGSAVLFGLYLLLMAAWNRRKARKLLKAAPTLYAPDEPMETPASADEPAPEAQTPLSALAGREPQTDPPPAEIGPEESTPEKTASTPAEPTPEDGFDLYKLYPMETPFVPEEGDIDD